MGSKAHLAIFCFGLTILGSCSADQSTKSKGLTKAEVRTDTETPDSVNSEWPQQAGLENDLTFCLSKAIAIHEDINLDKKYAPNHQLTAVRNEQSRRFQTLMKRMRQASNGFVETKFPL